MSIEHDTHAFSGAWMGSSVMDLGWHRRGFPCFHFGLCAIWTPLLSQLPDVIVHMACCSSPRLAFKLIRPAAAGPATEYETLKQGRGGYMTHSDSGHSRAFTRAYQSYGHQGPTLESLHYEVPIQPRPRGRGPSDLKYDLKHGPVNFVIHYSSLVYTGTRLSWPRAPDIDRVLFLT
jgi:hypothetical protein